jgi:glycine dehydrogenase subunit 1
VLTTFLKGHSELPQTISWTPQGTMDLDSLAEWIKKVNPCAVVVPSPNYFGIVEPLDKIKERLPSGCLLIAVVPDASALSIFEAPGKLGADIVVGEAHQLGTPMLFGGPHVGFFASRKAFLRQMPGRLCGESTDAKGRRAYALTLSTREQHIRREKATSNICTNQGLIALRTTIYLSFLGKRGFQRLGEMNYSLFDFLTRELEAHGIRLKFKNAINYREGVFEVPSLDSRFHNSLERKIIPGIKLAPKMGKLAEEFKNSLLVTVHPKHTKADLEALVEVLSHG